MSIRRTWQHRTNKAASLKMITTFITHNYISMLNARLECSWSNGLYYGILFQVLWVSIRLRLSLWLYVNYITFLFTKKRTDDSNRHGTSSSRWEHISIQQHEIFQEEENIIIPNKLLPGGEHFDNVGANEILLREVYCMKNRIASLPRDLLK